MPWVTGSRMIWLPLPLVLVLLFAVIGYFLAPPATRDAMLMGRSARICPFLVLACAQPPLAGLIWAMRGLAPTRLAETGFIIGLAAAGRQDESERMLDYVTAKFLKPNGDLDGLEIST